MPLFSRHPFVFLIAIPLLFSVECKLSAQDWPSPGTTPPPVGPPQPGLAGLQGMAAPGAGEQGAVPVQPTAGQPVVTPNPVQTPRSVAPKIPTPSEQPEAYRSLLTRGHPLTGLLDDAVGPFAPDAPIQGKPLPLYELLEGDRSPQRRRQLLHAYWDLTGSVAKHKLYAVREETIRVWYQDYARNAAQNEFHRRRTPLLHAAQQRAAHQREILALEVLEKQYALQVLRNPQFMAQRSGEEEAEHAQRRELPLPCDYPLDGAYLTRIDKMPTASLEARRLDRRLTIAYRALREHYGAAIASRAILKVVYERENSDVFDTLSAYDQSLAVEEKMIDAIIGYNTLIADYTSETIPAGIGLYPLLTALIKLPDPASLSPAPASPAPASSPLYTPSESQGLPLPGTPPGSPQPPASAREPQREPGRPVHTPPLGMPGAHSTFPPAGQPSSMQGPSTPPVSIPDQSPADPGPAPFPELPPQPSPLF